MKPPGLDAFWACVSVDTFLSNPGNRQFCHCLNCLSLLTAAAFWVSSPAFPQHWFPAGHWEFFNQNRTGDFFFSYFWSAHIHWSCPRSKDCLTQRSLMLIISGNWCGDGIGSGNSTAVGILMRMWCQWKMPAQSVKYGMANVWIYEYTSSLGTRAFHSGVTPLHSD